MRTTTLRVNGSLPMASIVTGWTTPALWKYAHVCQGSVVVRTFHGPGALSRAIKFVEVKNK